MAGRLVNLSEPVTRIPGRLVVDTSIVVDWLLAAAELPWAARQVTVEQIRAASFVSTLRQSGTIGLLASTTTNEVFHFLIRTKYRAERANYQTDLQASYPEVRRHDWHHLYKARSDLLEQFAIDLHRTHRVIRSAGFLFLQPDELGPIASGRSLDEAVLWAVERYQLDTNDAAILVEAQRAGVSDIATSDADLRRAQLDFDVYTWI